MIDERDLKNFSGICRLFPLPRVVMFPHTILPLHIFEPRYRQMTIDALAGDGLVTMVQLETTSPFSATLGTPPIATIGCLGRIIQHERLPEGRFNFLLLGCRRVRLHREIPTDKLYRLAEAEILEEVADPINDEPARGDLIALFREVFGRQREIDPDMTALLESALPLDVLTDIVAHTLRLPSEMKQALLAEPQAAHRASVLLETLRQHLSHSAPPLPTPGKFPPSFSTN